MSLSLINGYRCEMGGPYIIIQTKVTRHWHNLLHGESYTECGVYEYLIVAVR